MEMKVCNMCKILHSNIYTTTADQTAWPSERRQDAKIWTCLVLTSHINFVSCRYYTCLWRWL